jgi:hypothetical protein
MSVIVIPYAAPLGSGNTTVLQGRRAANRARQHRQPSAGSGNNMTEDGASKWKMETGSRWCLDPRAWINDVNHCRLLPAAHKPRKMVCALEQASGNGAPNNRLFLLDTVRQMYCTIVGSTVPNNVVADPPPRRRPLNH